MKQKTPDLIHGKIFKNLMRFSIPYLLSCFLQTFYGLADLFITGQFCDEAAISGVANGSQVTHMATVVIAGMVVGTTVAIGRAVGAGKRDEVRKITGNAIIVFAVFAFAATLVLYNFVPQILTVLKTPAEALPDAAEYLRICFAGLPFIIAYNVISGIFRGMGDSVRPMIFVGIAGIANIFLDILFIGGFGLRAAGAAYATVISQGISVGFCLIYVAVVIRKRRAASESGAKAAEGGETPAESGKLISPSDFMPGSGHIKFMLATGVPIALQEGIIQVSFLVITAIANGRGLDISAAVGITEKIITFLFLVPSAMMSSVATMASQNIGAQQWDRARAALRCGIAFAFLVGAAAALVCNIFAVPIIGMFSDSENVVMYGAQYLRSYVFDCVFASIHFCFCGYFSACGKSYISFIQNMTSACLVRIPLAWMTTQLFPDTLYPMGWAAPAGSLFSSAFCIAAYVYITRKKEKISG